jgi:hypothetical protein
MALFLVPCPSQWNKTKIIAQGMMLFEIKLYMDYHHVAHELHKTFYVDKSI